MQNSFQILQSYKYIIFSKNKTHSVEYRDKIQCYTYICSELENMLIEISDPTILPYWQYIRGGNANPHKKQDRKSSKSLASM